MTVIALVTKPKSTSFVFVLVAVGAVTVTTAELETPLKTVTGAGVLVTGMVVTAGEISSRTSKAAFLVRLTDYRDRPCGSCARGSRRHEISSVRVSHRTRGDIWIPISHRLQSFKGLASLPGALF